MYWGEDAATYSRSVHPLRSQELAPDPDPAASYSGVVVEGEKAGLLVSMKQALSLPNCVALDTLLNHSEPQFPHL